ncbi:MAG: hypothetical protein GC153_11775 [Alphaproteobacteria bacterium]|nr:hypothetical protein [Alphaproteobacteria bacterium]
MKRVFRLPALAAVLAASACASVHVPGLAGPKAESDRSFSFVVIGDTPYGDEDAAFLKNKVVPAIKNAPYPFVIHVGDDKSGGAPCTDGYDRDQAALIAALKPKPVFYTPGDNEWTDCDRNPDPATGRPMSELGRLSKLQSEFFSGDMKAPGAMHVRRQKGEPENQMWSYRGVRFVTLEVVGTNNGRDWVAGDPLDVAAKAADARDAHNIAWLREAVAAALKQKAKALVIAMQADMTNVDPANRGTPCTDVSTNGEHACDGFARIVKALIDASVSYSGPILLIHGDTEPFTLASGDWGAANLWRLNAAGDVHAEPDGTEGGLRDATEVTITPGSPYPFSAKALVSGVAPASE